MDEGINYSLYYRLTSSHPNYLTPCDGLVAPTNYLCYGAKYTQQHLLEPIGEPLYPFFKPLYDVLESKGAAIGLKADQTVFVLMLFMTYFWSMLFRILFNNRTMKNQVFLKNVYLAIIGVFYCLFTFGYEGFHAIACSFVSYLGMLVLPKSISSKFVFAYVWIYLSAAYVVL